MNKDEYERTEIEEKKESVTREENAVVTEETTIRKTEEKKVTNNEEDGAASNGDVESTEFTDAGDIGDEQLPAGDIKTDKRVWDYSAEKSKEHDLPKKIKEFIAGL